jgi:hypothetical protein
MAAHGLPGGPQLIHSAEHFSWSNAFDPLTLLPQVVGEQRVDRTVMGEVHLHNDFSVTTSNSACLGIKF